MTSAISWISRIGDKAGALGALVSAMGCAMCFSAIATIGGAIGLGFLQQWEGLFVNTLLPAFALLALVVNVLGWLAHRQWLRTTVAIVGPLLLLLSLYPWFQYGWSSYVTYAALALMIAVAVWDLVSPTHRRCGPDGCELPASQQSEQSQ